jgi:hypothetical protein
MKRMLFPLLLLACVAACAPAPSNNANTNANMNASNMNAANSNTTSSANPADADLIAKEREIYDDVKKKDTAAFGAMVTDDFIYVSSDAPAPHDKAETTKQIGASRLTDISLTNFKVVRIDKDAAVVIYDSEGKGTSADGKPFDDKARESSVWVNRGGKWLAIFHQDCAISPPMPPPASANSNANANSNKATTAASPSSTATTTSDAVADEKMVWEAIKRGDSNGFGNLLADDAIEVEPDKVYTKTESVSVVPTLGFLSSTTLSDFKSMKIDDDASIVTYTVKGTGPDKKAFTEQHSTVWANRNGKWQAAFHQGTPFMPPAPPAAK